MQKKINLFLCFLNLYLALFYHTTAWMFVCGYEEAVCYREDEKMADSVNTLLIPLTAGMFLAFIPITADVWTNRFCVKSEENCVYLSVTCFFMISAQFSFFLHAYALQADIYCPEIKNNYVLNSAVIWFLSNNITIISFFMNNFEPKKPKMLDVLECDYGLDDNQKKRSLKQGLLQPQNKS